MGLEGWKRVNGFTLCCLAFLSFGSITYGYTLAIIGTTSGQPTFIKYFNLDKPGGTNNLATMNGLFHAGGVLGPLLLPYVSDKWGRKWAITVPAIMVVISGAVLGGSTHIAQFIAFRFLGGAGAYMITGAVPLWMNEIAPEDIRGALVDLHAVGLIFGFCIQGWIGYAFYFWQGGSNTWRVPLILQCAWPLILLCGIYWIPESPRWLFMQDRAEEGRAVLQRLHAHPSDPENNTARLEAIQIQKQIAIDQKLDNGWIHMFTKRSNLKRSALAIATTFFNQCSGVLVISSYGPSLYANLGYSTDRQLLFIAGWLTLTLGTNILGVFLVDRFARNKFMAFGLFGCMATLAVEAALVANFVPSDNTHALQAAVAMFFVFELFYGTCLDGTQFSYLGEIFPTHLRAKGVSLGVSMLSLANIIWLQAAPTAFETIGYKYYIPIIVTGTVGGFIFLFLFPDTKGLPLEEIAAIFGDQDEVAIYRQDIDSIDMDSKPKIAELDIKAEVEKS